MGICVKIGLGRHPRSATAVNRRCTVTDPKAWGYRPSPAELRLIFPMGCSGLRIITILI